MRSMLKASALHIALASTFVFVSAAQVCAQADADATARARALFREGVGCVQAEDWECAVARFRAALALHDAPSIRYNLAAAVLEQGQYAEALQLATSVVEDEATRRPIRRRAQQLVDAIEEEGCVATVTVQGAPPGAELRVDGEPVEPSAWAGLVLAPGPHRFTLLEQGRELTEVQVETEAGTRTAVALHVVAAPVEAAPEPAPEPEPPSGSLLEDPVFWAVAGGSAAAVVLIVVIAAVAASSGAEEPIEGDFMPTVLRW